MLSTDLVGVFGANSFIGRHVVKCLLASNIPVIAYGRKFGEDFFDFIGLPVETRVIDLNNDIETFAAIQGLTHVVQLINTSNPAVGNSRVVSDLLTNVVPHVNFIEGCIASGIKNYVFISSGGTVYGRPRVMPIPESHPTDPLNSYGMAKRMVEKYLTMLSRGTNMGFTILRVANPYGPGQLALKGQGLVPTILQRHEMGRPLTIFGDGLTMRDFVYIDDVVDAVKAAVERGPFQDCINIGSGEGATILDVVETIEGFLGTQVLREFVDFRVTDAPCNVLDVRKAHDLLGWRPTTVLSDGLRKTVDAFLKG